MVIRDAKRAIRYAGHILELAIGTGNNYLSLKNDFDRDSNRLNKSCYSRVIKRGCFFLGTRENCENSIRGLCFLLNSNSKKCTSLQKFDYHRAFEYTHSGYHCFTSNNYTIIILSGPAKFLYFPEDLKNGGKKMMSCESIRIGNFC